MSDDSTASGNSDWAIAQRLRNLSIALVAAVLAAALFLALRAEPGTASLSSQAERATPLTAALTNDRPTLIEFYADWCTSCQAMAPELATLRADYADRVNFVMLNVDNTKWLPELLRYRVDGIPHFVYVDAAGEPLAAAIGEQPRAVLAANLDALVAGEPLPRARTGEGKTSAFAAQVQPASERDSPRSHGRQVRAESGAS